MAASIILRESAAWWESGVVRPAAAGESTCFIVGAVPNDLIGGSRLLGWMVRRLGGAVTTAADGSEQPPTRYVGIYVRNEGIQFADEYPGGRQARPAGGMRDQVIAAMVESGAVPAAAPVNPVQAAVGASNKAPEPFTAPGVLASLQDWRAALGVKALRGRLALIVLDIDTIAPDFDKSTAAQDQLNTLVLLQQWSRARIVQSAGSLIVGLCSDPGAIHRDLAAAASGWRIVRRPLPSADEIEALIRQEQSAESPLTLADGLTASYAARLCAGLNLVSVLEIIWAVRAEGRPLSPADIRDRKNAIIATTYGSVASMIEPLEGGLNAIGGADHIKAYFLTLAGRIARGARNVHKGILLAGAPGVGKTILVQALAGQTGWSAVKLDMSQIQDSLVGASERNLRLLFEFVRALSPCILFIDEMDQGDLGKRGDNSGNPVAANLFSMLMQFITDESLRGRVLIIAATNQPDRLDPALLRPGRFEQFIYVPLPDAAGRESIARISARRVGVTISDDAVAAAVAVSDRWSGADVDMLIREAASIAEDTAGSDTVTDAEITEAGRYLRPRTPMIAGDYAARAAGIMTNLRYADDDVRAAADAVRLAASRPAPSATSQPEPDTRYGRY